MIRLFVACFVAALATVAPVHAQVFGQFTGAEPLPVNTRLFGAYIHSSNNEVGLLGQLRLSFYPNVDFGFQGGLARHDFGSGPGSDSRTTVRLGADFKVRVASQQVGAPVAVAVGAALGVETGDNWSILTLGPTVVASHSFPVGGGQLTPYAGVGLLYSSIDVETLNDTDVAFPIRFGLDTQVATTLRILIEMQLKISDDFSDDSILSAGVNLPF